MDASISIRQALMDGKVYSENNTLPIDDLVNLIIRYIEPQWIPISKAIEMGYAKAIGKLDDPNPPEVFILLPGRKRRVTFGFLVVGDHAGSVRPIVTNYHSIKTPRYFMPVPKWPAPPRSGTTGASKPSGK